MLNMNKEEIKQEQNKGLIARILGGKSFPLWHAYHDMAISNLLIPFVENHVSIFSFLLSNIEKVNKKDRIILKLFIFLHKI